MPGTRAPTPGPRSGQNPEPHPETGVDAWHGWGLHPSHLAGPPAARSAGRPPASVERRGLLGASRHRWCGLLPRAFSLVRPGPQGLSQFTAGQQVTGRSRLKTAGRVCVGGCVHGVGGRGRGLEGSGVQTLA